MTVLGVGAVFETTVVVLEGWVSLVVTEGAVFNAAVADVTTVATVDGSAVVVVVEDEDDSVSSGLRANSSLISQKSPT